MKYTDLGLVSTSETLKSALRNKFAVPAFNVYNMETLTAVISAARLTHSPVILAISESALKYMGQNMLIGLISGAKISPSERIALHLDHGSSVRSCMQAIDIGFSSVMLDFSKRSLDENIAATNEISLYAHARDVTVESELGELSGIEDENTHNKNSCYTDPKIVADFVRKTHTDSLAVAIGTSHGAYKRKSADDKLRFDILTEIQEQIPYTPLVLHGASSIPQDFVDDINKFGGNIQDSMGIDLEQLNFAATQTNICKINIDSDLRLGTTAAIRKYLATNPAIFNPREYLSAARDTVQDYCIFLIREIFKSYNKI